MVKVESGTPAGGNRVLWLFVDGVGLGDELPDNPLVSTPTPALDALLGGPLTRHRVQRRDGLLLAAVDARLGVPGLPQSATGQTALFTGVNAARELGRHVTAYPGPRLRSLLEEHSVFRRAVERGHAVTFANPFTRGYFEAIESRRRRGHSATTWAVLAAGVELRGVADLAAGRAVSWDVVRDRFRKGLAEGEGPVAEVAAAEAGRHLAGLAGEHRLTLWETFLTDLAGHFRWGITGGEAVARVDGLLGGVLAAVGPDVTVVLTSDHGNVEEGGHKRHTLNPVPLLVVGPGAAAFDGVGSIQEVAGRVLEVLGPEEPTAGPGGAGGVAPAAGIIGS